MSDECRPGESDPSLADPIARVVGGDRAAETELVARLEPLIPTLLAIVRRGRPKELAARIHSTGVVSEAIFDLLQWLRARDPGEVIGADDVRRVLFHITRMRLLDAVRGGRRRGREVQGDSGALATAPAAPGRGPSDVPGRVFAAIEESGAASGPGGAGRPGNPNLDRAAEELVGWLENWGDELRSIHPKAIEIIDWSFCGWSTEQIGQILNLKQRTVQLIKQRLLPLLERKLGLGGDSDDDRPNPGVHP